MLTPDLLFCVFHFDRFDHLVYTVLDLVDDVGRNAESRRDFVYRRPGGFVEIQVEDAHEVLIMQTCEHLALGQSNKALEILTAGH